MPRLSKIGAAALAAFGWTGLSSVTASYLQVAGGGGGGSGDLGSIGGAGGGAGGYLTGTTSLNTTQSYTVVVGAGGAGGVYSGAGVSGVQGSNSQFGVLTASVGGGFGAYGTSGATGGNGGSGGGGTFGNAGGTATSGQGSNGGTGSSSLDCRGSGGGGGASAVGANGTSAGGGNGGNGTASSITGSSVTYAGGGGGGALYRGGGFTVPTVATGGTGGGGSSGTGTGGNGNPGTANLGGGGGGPVSINAGTFDRGGNGGSGVVIISYPSPQKFGGGIVTTDGTNTIHTFQTSGTLSPLSTLSASYLIVAGGGGGGCLIGGGGGAGGLQTGSGLTIDTNSIYLVTVGAGGLGSTSSSAKGSNGTSSAFSLVSTSSIGGGGGGSNLSENGASGASGGGAAGAGGGGTGGTATQGFAGGASPASSPYPSGGGGGAGAVGANGVSTQSGAGGVGVASSITGTSTYYAGGGGGGGNTTFSTIGGAGGNGGGGAGSNSGQGSAGTANFGGGGGGGDTGGAGGSGIVIISYAGATQLMAGGTVTITGGNVIHTFNSSGYLTPLTLVGNSLRFRSSASAYLNRTPPTAGNRQTWTWSAWVKRGTFAYAGTFSCYTGSGTVDNSYLEISFNSDKLQVSGYTTVYRQTTQVFRDPAAWYHIVVALDTTQATGANRVKVYVNGTQVTAFAASNDPTQNADLGINQAALHNICNNAYFSNYFDGYMTEVQFIDGQALTPNSFGTFNSFGVWQPITYGGSYGTNGFYLPFSNNASTTTLGFDFSPQGNNWTTNNISVTAGVTYDSMTDVPTLTSTTAANYATFNPIIPSTTNLINGNLTRNGSVRTNVSTFPAIGGKYYFETTIQDSNGNGGVGVKQTTAYPLQDSDTSKCATYFSNGEYKIEGASQTSGFSSYTNGDVIGCAVDSTVSPSKIWWSKNGTWQGTGNPTTAGYSLTAGLDYYFMVLHGSGSSSTTASVNFGQQPFVYTIPSGYTALNTFNL